MKITLDRGIILSTTKPFHTEVDGKQYPDHIAKHSHDRLMYDTIFHNPKLEWHCPGRHGVIREVLRKESGLVGQAIEYFYGRKGQWWKNTPGKKGFMDVEFVHMTKVYPPPREPWDWCGTSVLHENEHKIEKIQHEFSKLFSIGQKVSFIHKGQKIIGIICNKSKRATVVILGSETKWHVPFDELEMEL